MFRSFFLFLSASTRACRMIMALPFATRVARRFVAGETLDDAIIAIRKLNDKGIVVTLDHLGENVHTEADATRATQAYLDLLDRIAATKVNANASLKLTQLGLDVGEDLCVGNVRRILQRAKDHGNFVRIDMEGSAYTERTLRVFHTLRDDYEFKNVGIVIQSYLYRSEKDVRDLVAEGVNIRLVKGAYKEPPDIAFPAKADVDKNFVKLMQICLGEPAHAKGAFVALATHDENILVATKKYAAKQGLTNGQVEFQMLYGIRAERQEQLAAEGYCVRVYVPYGSEWYPYFMRRLAERPANVWFLVRYLF